MDDAARRKCLIDRIRARKKLDARNSKGEIHAQATGTKHEEHKKRKDRRGKEVSEPSLNSLPFCSNCSFVQLAVHGATIVEMVSLRSRLVEESRSFGEEKDVVTRFPPFSSWC